MEELLIKAAAEARRRTTQNQRGKRGSTQAIRSGSAFTAAMHGKQQAKKGKCYNCGKRGHFKSEFRSKKRFGKAFGGAESSRGSAGGAESGFVINVSISEPVGAEWIIDSGASSHMTGTRGLLLNLSKMAEDVVVTTASV